MNKLYYNDNLDVLEFVPDNSVDLVYMDPPFNTGKDWGEFNDKWEKGLAGYLDFMRPRIETIHCVLKDTGSLYLHCDPTASHYLKVLLDQVFGITNFRNEIVWCYTGVHPPKSKTFNKKHDTIFWYTKTNEWTFNKEDIRIPYTSLAFNDAYSGSKTPDKQLLEDYLDRGKCPETWWRDIKHIKHCQKELLKYPTQKPVALLERVIKASSNVGDVVLDPFCGSGTTLDAAHKLERKWIGIDEGQQAIETITMRLADQHGLLPNDDYELIGSINELELPTVNDAAPQQMKLF